MAAPPVPRYDRQDSPSISGPSFLGLNDPAPRSSSPRQRASLSIDPSQAPVPGSLDYLLEDDEEPKPSGAWKYVLIVVALALAVGFGYLRWKNQGLAWLNPSAKKPAAAVQEPDTTTSSSPTPAPVASTPGSTPSVTPDSQPPAGAAQPAASGTPSSSVAAANPATSAPPASNTPAPAAATSDASKSTSGANPPNSPGQGAMTAPATDTSAAASNSGATGTNAADASTQPAAATNPQPTANEPAPKPRPVVDPVTEAQKYLYGRGVPQNCDRGLRLLKPAANQANPKAMIEMGALYSAGLCTPRDLPTAYRWFALALRKQPDNTSLQADLQKLWSEMTQPERQLAIRLSQ